MKYLQHLQYLMTLLRAGTIACVLSLALQDVAWAGAVNYDIVYIRAPRYGDDTPTNWQEVFDPIRLEPGADLVLLHPDGTEEVLVPGGNGSIVDPTVSFDGQWVYYAQYYDLRRSAINFSVRYRGAPKLGADIFKIHVATREIVQLTFGEWTPNTGVADWSSDPTTPVPKGTAAPGLHPFNLGPCPLPGGRIMFTSSRNNFLPTKDNSFPNLQLFVMDDNGQNVELVGHFNLGSALHPTVLTDGRVMFSSYESQGLRSAIRWSLWSIWPDGRKWRPLMSALGGGNGGAFHFHTQLSNGDIAVVEYYNLSNNGFGTLLAFPSSAPTTVPPFGSPDERLNPLIQYGQQFRRYRFSPYGLYTLTPFAHGADRASEFDDNDTRVGKVTHPSGAPDNDVLLVWSPGPANDLGRPTNRPFYDGGIYLLRGGVPAAQPSQFVFIKNDPRYNEQQPRALVPYKDIHGIDEPVTLPWLPNDGTEYPPQLPKGTPFGLVGTSSFYKRNTTPGDGLELFNSPNRTSNWHSQGADAGKYDNSQIYAVRILAMEPLSIRKASSRSANSGFFNHADERLRILGEIPLRKFDSSGKPILDVDGNPDTSFVAKIPADVPFTFQTIDKDGLVLNMAQTWHQVRPGEARVDCGGCHAHAQLPTDFKTTAAARSSYKTPDLTLAAPVLSKDTKGNPIVITKSKPVDVEYYRDIKPILQRSCVGCHSRTKATPPANLVLDDTTLAGWMENTYTRLANDPSAEYGIPPVNMDKWSPANASRYVRKFQSRRSLLIWKIFGRRLDGWTNADFPTERVPGDATTLPIDPKTGKPVKPNTADLDFTGTIMPPPNSGYPPLSADEKILFARWVDLGAPISQYPAGTPKQPGWFLDELRPTLTVTTPYAGLNEAVLSEIRLGAFDYYSGLDRSSLSVKADFAINGRPADSELASLFKETGANSYIWVMSVSPPIPELTTGTLTVKVKDREGNWTTVERTFEVGAP